MLVSGLPSPNPLTYWEASGAPVVWGSLLVALVGNFTPARADSLPSSAAPSSRQSVAGTSTPPEWGHVTDIECFNFGSH